MRFPWDEIPSCNGIMFHVIQVEKSVDSLLELDSNSEDEFTGNDKEGIIKEKKRQIKVLWKL